MRKEDLIRTIATRSLQHYAEAPNDIFWQEAMNLATELTTDRDLKEAWKEAQRIVQRYKGWVWETYLKGGERLLRKEIEAIIGKEERRWKE